jgi:NAD(P)-dependent dehydrogenase (short-subunit alcohol dehydrogenase family)
MKKTSKKKINPPQKQKPPGVQTRMQPEPLTDNPRYVGSDKLLDKVALITGGDSGIGQAAAIIFAKEGADVVVVYLSEHSDAEYTSEQVEKYGRKCLLIPGDVSDEKFCKKAVQATLKHFGRIDILVNNAAEQHPKEDIEDISTAQVFLWLKLWNPTCLREAQ